MMSAKWRVFPFTALVGQEKAKRALLANAVSPDIGGVLLRGEKGTRQIYSSAWAGGTSAASPYPLQAANGTVILSPQKDFFAQHVRKKNGLERCRQYPLFPGWLMSPCLSAKIGWSGVLIWKPPSRKENVPSFRIAGGGTSRHPLCRRDQPASRSCDG